MKFRHSDGEYRMIADATPITDSPSANSGSGMMNARRSTQGRWLNIAIIIVFAAVMLAASTAPALADTPITNCTELQNMRNDLSGDYYLANDIDCSNTSNWNGGDGFEPIGTDSNRFIGTFDGNGYKITHLYINRPRTYYVGLFGYTDSVSEITNVSLEEVNIIGFNQVGGLVGLNVETITNSYWDISRSGQSTCVGVDSSNGCTGKNAGNSEPDYWYNSTHAPMDSWDFSTIWAIEEGVTCPYLQWQPAAAEPPDITSYAPESPVSNIAGATQTFNITIDQTVNVTWYINGTNVR